MSYSGRAVMSEVAAKAGWTEQVVGSFADHDCVQYDGPNGAEANIVWTPLNTATAVNLRLAGQEDAIAIRGATALIEVRNYIESTEAV